MLSGPGQFAENETNEVKFNQKHTFLNAAFTHMALIPVYVWHDSHFTSEIEICKKKKNYVRDFASLEGWGMKKYNHFNMN